MYMTRLVQILALLFCICMIIAENDQTKDDQSGQFHKDTAADQNADIIEISKKFFKDAIKLITKTKLYDELQDVLVHYVQHFLSWGKMTMKTKSGRITVPLNERIELNLTAMVRHIFHIECTSNTIKNKDFDFNDPVNQYRFIRNNTAILNIIIEHANASFRAHKEIENPQKIRFYNILKEDVRFFKMGHFYQSMDNLIELQKISSPSLYDLVTGKLYGNRSNDLNSEECLEIGKHASQENIGQTIQFYEAAVRRLDIYDFVMLNKTQILNEIINFYRPYGQVCDARVSQLQVQMENSLTEVKTDDEADADVDDDKKVDVNETDEKAKQAAMEKTNGAEVKVNDKVNDIKEDENSVKITLIVSKNGETRTEIVEIKNNKGTSEKIGNSEKDDELCIKEIIKRFSEKFSLNHDEL